MEYGAAFAHRNQTHLAPQIPDADSTDWMMDRDGDLTRDSVFAPAPVGRHPGSEYTISELTGALRTEVR